MTRRAVPLAPGYLTLAQLALDAGDDEAAAYWGLLSEPKVVRCRNRSPSSPLTT